MARGVQAWQEAREVGTGSKTDREKEKGDRKEERSDESGVEVRSHRACARACLQKQRRCGVCPRDA
eukprot:126176-Rhodomonas_salina.1